jgi:hypothetical protein
MTLLEAGNKQLLESSHTYCISSEFLTGTLLLQSAQSRELVPASGWHNVGQLRTDNGEQQAYQQLRSDGILGLQIACSCTAALYAIYE